MARVTQKTKQAVMMAAQQDLIRLKANGEELTARTILRAVERAARSTNLREFDVNSIALALAECPGALPPTQEAAERYLAGRCAQ